MNAVKASPAGMFPAAAAKAGITMGSKLGQAITKSPTGKLPEQMAQGASRGTKQMPSRGFIGKGTDAGSAALRRSIIKYSKK